MSGPELSTENTKWVRHDPNLWRSHCLLGKWGDRQPDSRSVFHKTVLGARAAADGKFPLCTCWMNKHHQGGGVFKDDFPEKVVCELGLKGSSKGDMIVLSL